MSPWGRFILEHIGIDGRGVFRGWDVILRAHEIWPTTDIQRWWWSLVDRSGVRYST